MKPVEILSEIKSIRDEINGSTSTEMEFWFLMNEIALHSENDLIPDLKVSARKCGKVINISASILKLASVSLSVCPSVCLSVTLFRKNNNFLILR